MCALDTSFSETESQRLRGFATAAVNRSSSLALARSLRHAYVDLDSSPEKEHLENIHPEGYVAAVIFVRHEAKFGSSYAEDDLSGRCNPFLRSGHAVPCSIQTMHSVCSESAILVAEPMQLYTAILQYAFSLLPAMQ